jgi:hypothetical protein
MHAPLSVTFIVVKMMNLAAILLVAVCYGACYGGRTAEAAVGSRQVVEELTANQDFMRRPWLYPEFESDRERQQQLQHQRMDRDKALKRFMGVQGRFDLHSFPEVDHSGMQLANEFQLLHPENIDTSRLTNQGNDDFYHDQYMITNIHPLVISNDGIVNVSYYSSYPQYGDWIGIYSPYVDADNISNTVPVKYGWCDVDDNYYKTGHGSMLFNLTNLRQDLAVYYFTDELYYPKLQNISSQRISYENINEPLRPRVVATGDYDVLKLLWSSANSQSPVMKWGTASGVYTNVVDAVTTTIEQDQMCGWPANSNGWRELGLIHTANFTGLLTLSSDKIYYVFGDSDTDNMSGEFVLTLPPLPGKQPANRPTTVILYDDLGRGSTDHTYTWNEYGRPAIYTAMSVGARSFAGGIDAVYHGGDLSYATGYEAVWDFYLDMLSPITGRTLYLTTVGNHESDWPGTASYYTGDDSGGECGVCATTLMPMPSPAVTNEPWWSYEVGLIHFIGMSTEHNYTHGSKQYFWLENDLMNINRTKTPWVIFGGHRAMYINSNYSGTVTSDVTVMNLMIKSLEPLLWKYRVNIGFYGHNHVVQRQSAVYNKTVVQASVPITQPDGSVIHYHDNPQATVQMVVGTGGAGFTKNAYYPGPAWNEAFFYKWGYAVVTAVNASYLDWQWVNSLTEEVLDHMVITQVDPNEPWVLPENDDDSSNHNHKLSTGAIAGITIATIVLAVGIAVAVFYYIRIKNPDYCQLGDASVRGRTTVGIESDNPMYGKA